MRMAHVPGILPFSRAHRVCPGVFFCATNGKQCAVPRPIIAGSYRIMESSPAGGMSGLSASGLMIGVDVVKETSGWEMCLKFNVWISVPSPYDFLGFASRPLILVAVNNQIQWLFIWEIQRVSRWGSTYKTSLECPFSWIVFESPSGVRFNFLNHDSRDQTIQLPHKRSGSNCVTQLEWLI